MENYHFKVTLTALRLHTHIYIHMIGTHTIKLCLICYMGDKLKYEDICVSQCALGVQQLDCLVYSVVQWVLPYSQLKVEFGYKFLKKKKK